MMKSLFQPKPNKHPNEAEKLNWLRLIRTDNVGPVTFYRLLEQFGTVEAALEALPEMAKRGGRKRPLKSPSMAQVEKEYARLQKLGADILIASEADYPLALAAINDAPPVISVLGNKACLNQPSIAIVGARNASLNGKKFATKIARELGAQDMIVTSGFARGIDTAAHEGALATGTIAVLAGGIDNIYPEENANLYNQIKEQGAIIAESPLGTAPKPQHFPRRNRIVSGISKGVIVVEANLKSGSLITARMAGEQGRDVFAVPGHPYDPRASGPNALIRDGAILVRGVQDILEALNSFSGGGFGERAQPDLKAVPSAKTVTDEHRREIINALSFSAIAVDELIRSCHLNIGIVQTVLLELELAGRLKRLPGNAVSLIEEEDFNH